MSFSADVEHIYAPPHTLAPTIRGVFAKGCCTVWADEQFVAAIPATNDETNELADLFDVAVIALEDGAPEYYALRDKLCGDLGYQRLSLLFQQEMEREKAKEESIERASTLACAARRNIKPLEPLKAPQNARITQKQGKYVVVDDEGNARSLSRLEKWLYKLRLKEHFDV